MAHSKNTLRNRTDGGPAIEAAFTVLLLVIFIVGIVEFAFGYWVVNSMQLAVDAGGRYAIAHHRVCKVVSGVASCSCNSNIVSDTQTVVSTVLPGGLTFTGPNVTCTGNTSGSGCCQGSASTPLSPATLSIQVNYDNTFLNVFGYSLGSAGTFPMD